MEFSGWIIANLVTIVIFFITVGYYKGKVDTITKDNELRPLYAPVGQQTNIDIDFRYVEDKVIVSVVPWGTVGQDVEM